MNEASKYFENVTENDNSFVNFKLALLLFQLLLLILHMESNLYVLVPAGCPGHGVSFGRDTLPPQCGTFWRKSGLVEPQLGLGHQVGNKIK